MNDEVVSNTELSAQSSAQNAPSDNAVQSSDISESTPTAESNADAVKSDKVEQENSLDKTEESTQSKDHGKKFDRKQIAKIAKEAEERGRAQAIADYQRKFVEAANRGQPKVAQNNIGQDQTDPQSSQIDVEKILNNAVNEILAAKSVQAEIEAEKGLLLSKLIGAKEKYSDFEEVTNGLEKYVNPYTAKIFNSVENAGDVIYELGKNPQLLAQVTPFLDNPAVAIRVLAGVSNSIKANQAAKVQQKAPPPLSQETPSHTSADNGKLTAYDYSKLPSHRF